MKKILSLMVLATAATMVPFTPAVVSADQNPGTPGRLIFWHEPAGANCKSIATVAADGTDYQVVSDCATNGIVSSMAHPVWSPDMTKVAFVEFGSGKLFTMNADGTNITELTWDDSGNPTSFSSAWNIDWAEDDVLWVCEGVGGSRLHRYTISTGATQIVDVDVDCWNVNQSPDGETLVFHDYFNVYTAPVSDPADYTLVPGTDTGDVQHTSWAPDGESILYQDESSGTDILYTVPADGSAAPTALLRESVLGYQLASPIFSMDYTKLAFLAKGTPQPIYIANSDGSNPVNIFDAFGLTGKAGALNWGGELGDLPPREKELPSTGSDMAAYAILGLFAAMAGLVSLRARRTA